MFRRVGFQQRSLRLPAEHLDIECRCFECQQTNTQPEQPNFVFKLFFVSGRTTYKVLKVNFG
jgi:hypothetical protein